MPALAQSHTARLVSPARPPPQHMGRCQLHLGPLGSQLNLRVCVRWASASPLLPHRSEVSSNHSLPRLSFHLILKGREIDLERPAPRSRVLGWHQGPGTDAARRLLFLVRPGSRGGCAFH